jgi:protein SCO1
MRLLPVSRVWVLGVLAVGMCAAQPLARPTALRGIEIDQKLGNQIPLDLTFRDEGGNAVRLGDYFRGRPVVLSLVYYQCPMLCNLMLNGQLRSFRKMPLDIARDYDVVTVSFDPTETAPLAKAKKVEYIEKYDRRDAEDGWHFLTGDESQIRALADAVGFHYSWDSTTNQWVHASAIMVATPDGLLNRYMFGIEYAPRDLRLSLVEASAGKIGSPVDKILLFCFHYDPSKGKYTMAVMNTLRAGGSATLLAIGLFLFVNLRRDRRREH